MRTRLALPLAAASLLLLPGCAFGPSWGAGAGGTASAELSPDASVRNAIPALEAYWADNSTYAGATVAGLRERYDARIGGVRFVGPRTAETYCLESTGPGPVFSKHGPTASIEPRPCGAS